MAAFLTPERKRLLLIGAVLIVALLLVKQFVLTRSVPEAIPIVVPVHHVATAKQAAHAKHAKAVVKIDSSLPAALRTALRGHPVVVAVLYASHAPGDDEALKAARSGAKDAHAGFAVLNVANEKVAQSVALKFPGTADPSVLIVRRPGKITVLLPGYRDSDVVAEAVHNAR